MSNSGTMAIATYAEATTPLDSRRVLPPRTPGSTTITNKLARQAALNRSSNSTAGLRTPKPSSTTLFYLRAYGAYVLVPDVHNIKAVCHEAE
jgi:hypothetical protein